MRTRRPSPLQGRRPTREDLQRFATDDPHAMDDVLPPPGDPLRLLVVGINPGLWTAAVNAPFARPGNRFWASLHRAGLTGNLIDASCGLDEADGRELTSRGIGITNLVGRATARADQLDVHELQEGGRHLVERVEHLRPTVVAVVGITAYRSAFGLPRAQLGRQASPLPACWPAGTDLWVVPQPSGLNAHATVESLARDWRAVARAAGVARANST